jgi:hypothetical protein
MTKDYQSIIREGLHMELAEWLQAKRRRSMPKVRRSKRRLKLSNIFEKPDDETMAAISIMGAFFLWILIDLIFVRSFWPSICTMF